MGKNYSRKVVMGSKLLIPSLFLISTVALAGCGSSNEAKHAEPDHPPVNGEIVEKIPGRDVSYAAGNDGNERCLIRYKTVISEDESVTYQPLPVPGDCIKVSPKVKEAIQREIDQRSDNN